MSSFELCEIESREEFDLAVDVVFETFHTPYRPETFLLSPIPGDTEAEVEASRKADKDRRWTQHISNPASHWFCVKDISNGRMVGAAEWELYTENPFPNGPPTLECTWFPEGEKRDFVSNMLNQIYYARAHWMHRPFTALNEMYVLPGYQRRGVGSLLMSWGIQKSDELDIESIIEASDIGRDLYEKFGYQYLLSMTVNPHRRDPSLHWIRMVNEFGAPGPVNVMWRRAQKNGTKSLWEVMRSS